MLTVAVLDARVINVALQVEQEMQCPFYSGGLFVTEERSECGDDFMEVAPRQLPDCKGHCCRLQHSTGAQPFDCCRACFLLLHGNPWEQWQLCSILLRCKVWTKTKASSSRQGMHPRRQAAHRTLLLPCRRRLSEKGDRDAASPTAVPARRQRCLPLRAVQPRGGAGGAPGQRRRRRGGRPPRHGHSGTPLSI